MTAELKLLNGEYPIGPDGELTMTSRGWAADLLKEVAMDCEYGMFPADISAFDVGRALGRALSNYPEGRMTAIGYLLRGLAHHTAQLDQAEGPAER